MTTYFSEEHSVEAVNGRMAPDTDPRLKQVMASLVKHLHAFAKDVELTQAEWDYAIEFLTDTGHLCSEDRQEFILLSDTLGFSMLVDSINNRRPEGATENTVFGPFHIDDVPVRQMGDVISMDGKGEPCLYIGNVQDLEGNPIEGAVIDVWSDNADGFYDVQEPDTQPRGNNRGLFTTGADGAYHFIGVKPPPYPIPFDGTVGKMLAALGRPYYRPGHMHFMVIADGYEKIVTHSFVAGDPHLERDAVFGVKEQLILDFEKVDDDEVEWRSEFDIVMVPTP
ncbi:MAG: dioxygenase [Pseudomonadota bacterium]